MLLFDHIGSMCLKKEVRKAHTFVIGPNKHFLRHRRKVYILGSIVLIKTDHNNIFLFSLLYPPTRSNVGIKYIYQYSLYQ